MISYMVFVYLSPFSVFLNFSSGHLFSWLLNNFILHAPYVQYVISFFWVRDMNMPNII